MASIDLDSAFRNKEKNRWSVENSNSTNRGQVRARRGTIKSLKMCRAPRKESGPNNCRLPIADSKNYDIAEKTKHYIQVNHMIKKPKIIYAEAEQNLWKTEFNFKVDLKVRIHKPLVDPKLLQLRICIQNNQKGRTPNEFSPVFSELLERFGLLFVGDKIFIPEEVKKISQLVQLTVGQEKQNDFSGKLHSILITGEPYILRGINRYCKRPIVWICNSTDAKEVINILDSFFNLYRVPRKIKLDRGSASICKDFKEFCKKKT